MRSTVLIDDDLVERAKEITGIKKTSPMLNEVLRDYIRRDSLKQLIDAKGSRPDLVMPARRRF
jgi:Arc/MetJ family transcription regulator